MQLGEHLREARRKRGMSLTKLAERTELSIGFLSQLERDQVNASLASLKTVAEALGLSLPQLFAQMDGKTASVITPDQRLVVEDGDMGSRFEFITDGAPSRLMPCFVKLDVGGMTSERPARHGGTEFATVLTGELAYHVGDEVFPLKEGDSVVFDATVPHRVVNTGGTPCTWLWVSMDYS